MRTLATLAYGVGAALLLVVVAASLIGTPDPGEARPGGLTAATVLRSDGSRADAGDVRPAPPRDGMDRPSS